MLKHKKGSGALRLLSSALIAGFFAAGASAHAADIKVGVIVPLSGPVAAQGLSTVKGIKAGVEYQSTVNGHQLKVLQLDDAPHPSITPRTARKLIERRIVDVLIGTSSVPGAMALATVSREGKTPLVSFTPSELRDDAASWAVTTTQSGHTMVSAVVDEMKRNGVKTVGYIGFADAWGDVAYAALQQYAEEAGIKVVANE